MVDDKVVDQVWVTVVATGYGNDRRPLRRREPSAERKAAEQRNGLEQAARSVDREPRVVSARHQRGGLGEIEVPEFVPPRR
jgi:hypothetical protein